jgi:hypothetical protein
MAQLLGRLPQLAAVLGDANVQAYLAAGPADTVARQQVGDACEVVRVNLARLLVVVAVDGPHHLGHGCSAGPADTFSRQQVSAPLSM